MESELGVGTTSRGLKSGLRVSQFSTEACLLLHLSESVTTQTISTRGREAGDVERTQTGSL